MVFLRASSPKALISLVALLALTSPLPAQNIDITRGGSFLTLTYVKPANAAVTVQKTSDLVSWTVMESADDLISQDSLGQLVQSTVSVAGLKRFFLRVRFDAAWKVTLAWNASPDPSVTGYSLHYGTAPGKYDRHLIVGSVTRSSVLLPVTAKACYFVATAYNSFGIESFPSKEVKLARPRSVRINRRG